MAKNAIYRGKPYHVTNEAPGRLELYPFGGKGESVELEDFEFPEEDLNEDPTDSEWADALDGAGWHDAAKKVRPPSDNSLLEYAQLVEQLNAVAKRMGRRLRITVLMPDDTDRGGGGE